MESKSENKVFTLTDQINYFKEHNQCIDEYGNTDCHNFFDWFCKKASLENRSIALMKKVISFLKVVKLDTDKYRVIFKNNCPLIGNLYDDFRIVDIETDDVVYCVVPKSGHKHDDAKAGIYYFNRKDPTISNTPTKYTSNVSYSSLLKELKVKSELGPIF